MTYIKNKMEKTKDDFFVQFSEIINSCKRIMVTTHMNPDGDGLGSELAVWRLMSQVGKETLILNSDPVPENYSFLTEFATYNVYSQNDHFSEKDLIIVLDISDLKRLGRLSEAIRSCPAKKVCIDHHAANSGFADLNYIDSSASSTGELVYRISKSMGMEIDSISALGIYTAIITDTGAFKYSNTTSSVHRISAEMIDAGVSPDYVYGMIYEHKSEKRMRLLGNVLREIKSSCNGRIVWSEVTLEMRKKENVEYEETDGFIDQLGFISGMEVYLLFLERDDGKIKVSLRSKNNFDVNRFAGKFNGGGHTHASGILLEGEMENIRNKVITSLENDMSGNM